MSRDKIYTLQFISCYLQYFLRSIDHDLANIDSILQLSAVNQHLVQRILRFLSLVSNADSEERGGYGFLTDMLDCEYFFYMRQYFPGTIVLTCDERFLLERCIEFSGDAFLKPIPCSKSERIVANNRINCIHASFFREHPELKSPLSTTIIQMDHIIRTHMSQHRSKHPVLRYHDYNKTLLAT